MLLLSKGLKLTVIDWKENPPAQSYMTELQGIMYSLSKIAT